MPNAARTAKELAERYRLFLDTAGSVILVLSPDGDVLEWNREAERVYGWSRDEMLGKNYIEICLPEGVRTGVRDDMKQVLAGRPTRGYENAVRSRDGVERILLWNVSRLANGSDEVIGIIASGQEITAQKQAEAELRDREARLRSILDTAADGIVTVDERGAIESFNSAAEQLFGYRGEEVIGRWIGLLIPEPHRSQVDQYLMKYVDTGEARISRVCHELTAQRKDGTTFPMELSIGELARDTGKLFTGIVRDLSEKRLLEEKYQQSQKMEALGTLASGVAHDFNNLLMGLHGCASIARSALPPKSPACFYLDEIKGLVESGAAITRQLLAFARKRPSDARAFMLDDAVCAQEQMLRRLLGEDVELVVKSAAPGLQIRCDPAHIELMLMNFAANARDAMPMGGRLEIQTRPVGLGRVALTVSDSGFGMAEETRRRVFEPFFTTKAPGRGTGLGLATVYGIVKQAGGDITVSSQPGEGTTFELTLPCVREPATTTFEGSNIHAPVGGSETILLVEDERLVRLAIRHYLERNGYRVLEARCGPEAIECCQRYPAQIDLLLADVVLPSMSGPHTARLVEELRPGIKVLHISAHEPEWLEDQLQLDSGTETLQKPFDEANLLMRVREVLRAIG
jgi:PAS domain S-box-containing protein